METEEFKKTVIEPTKEAKKCEIFMMFREFFRETPLSVVILALFWSIVFIIGAVYTGVRFFRVVEVREQIMYAAGFICFVFGLGLMKIFSWEIMNRNRIEKDIKHLELRITHSPGYEKKDRLT